MKNRDRSFILFLLLITVFSSCKKEVENCRLGKYYVSNGNTTPAPNVFSYYEDRRLQKIVYSDGSTDSLFYSADTLFITTYDFNDSLIATLRGIANSTGYLISATKTTFNAFSGAVTSIDTYFNEYNANGNLTKQTITNSGGTTILVIDYLNGNSVTGAFYLGANLDKEYIFYHNTVANKTAVDDFNGVFTPYYGKPSVNLLDSIHIISLGDTLRLQYTHTLDGNDYISKTVQTFLNSTNAQTKYHTYQYFDCVE